MRPTAGEIRERMSEIQAKPNGYGKYQAAYRHYAYVVPALLEALAETAADRDRFYAVAQAAADEMDRVEEDPDDLNTVRRAETHDKIRNALTAAIEVFTTPERPS